MLSGIALRAWWSIESFGQGGCSYINPNLKLQCLQLGFVSFLRDKDEDHPPLLPQKMIGDSPLCFGGDVNPPGKISQPGPRCAA